MTPPIFTPRLMLRPFELADIETAYQMNLDPEVTKFTGDGGVVSLEETARRIKEDVLGDYEKYGFGRFVVELKSSRQFIGFCGLKCLSDSQEVDLGFRFRKEFWGQGLATEAGQACVEFGFEELQLKQIIALVLPENAASVRVLEKLGFSHSGSLIEEKISINKYSIKKEYSK